MYIAISFFFLRHTSSYVQLKNSFNWIVIVIIIGVIIFDHLECNTKSSGRNLPLYQTKLNFRLSFVFMK